MIERQHDLFGVKTQFGSDLFQRVDGGSVDIGLAGLAQPAITGADAVTLEQAFQGGRTAVRVARSAPLPAPASGAES